MNPSESALESFRSGTCAHPDDGGRCRRNSPSPPREVESYSSLVKLCDYPHEWVLQYAARLRAGRAAAVMDGTRLFGNLGHRLFEEFFRTRADWPTLPDEAVFAWVRSELPGIIEREGAVLLGHGARSGSSASRRDA